jgi:hypothetical protein
MSSVNGNSPPLPTPAQVANLKRLAAGIIRVQGNRFIKELLRDKGIRIGVNKDDSSVTSPRLLKLADSCLRMSMSG